MVQRLQKTELGDSIVFDERTWAAGIALTSGSAVPNIVAAV